MRHLEDDGFPPVGTYLQAGDHLYCTVNYKGEPHVEKYKDLSGLERSPTARVRLARQPRWPSFRYVGFRTTSPPMSSKLSSWTAVM